MHQQVVESTEFQKSETRENVFNAEAEPVVLQINGDCSWIQRVKQV